MLVQLGKVALDSEVPMVGSDAWNMNSAKKANFPATAKIRRLGRG